MEKIKLVLVAPLLMVICLLGCPGSIKYNCGDQYYTCDEIFSTLPYTNPIRFDTFNDVILYADGTLVQKTWRSHNSYDLNQICGSDTIIDIGFYDQELRIRNSVPDSIPIHYDGFVVALSPVACYKLLWYDDLEFRFGDTGPDSVRLIDAIDLDIDHLQKIYIIDRGDYSIKIFNKEGAFISKISNIGIPKRFKIYDEMIWLLDGADNSIKQYSMDGLYLGQVISGDYFEDIVAFKPYYSSIWLSDMGGSRIIYKNIHGNIVAEFQGHFCFKDAIFNIDKIVDLADGVSVVDMENDQIVIFVHE